MKVSVVIPVFNDLATLQALVARLESTGLSNQLALEIIIVDDGSNQPTWRELKRLKSGHFPTDVTLVRLRENSGQALATLLGIIHCQHPYIVTMDADLQHPPEEIPRLVGVLDERNIDLVYGSSSKGHPACYRYARAPFGWLASCFTPAGGSAQVSSFRALRAALKERALAAKARPFASFDDFLQCHARGIFAVTTRHGRRRHGRSSYSLWRRISLAISIITASTQYRVLLICLAFLTLGYLATTDEDAKANAIAGAALGFTSIEFFLSRYRAMHLHRSLATLTQRVRETIR